MILKCESGRVDCRLEICYAPDEEQREKRPLTFVQLYQRALSQSLLEWIGDVQDETQ